MAITAPYNFVPLNKYVYIPQWWNRITQDIPFQDGEDGIIELEISNLSPLFIRNGEAQNRKKNQSKNDDSFSSFVQEKDENGLLHKRYFIPAASLKGMLRSVMEVLSFGKMNQYNNDYFGYRNFDTKSPDNHSYIKHMETVQGGWLRMEKDNYLLTPCAEDIRKISYVEIGLLFPHFNRVGDAQKKQESIKNDTGLYPLVEGKYRLVCTGKIHNKKHEYLFTDKRSGDKSYVVDKDVIKSFLTVHKPSPLFEAYWKKELKAGRDIPVFFNMEENSIKNIGLSRMYRYPYVHNVKDGINQVFRTIDNDGEVGYDLCESVFGNIGKETALKGRIHIGNAFAANYIDDAELINTDGVLGQPKASYYPLYLKQPEGKYSTYDNDSIEIAGRKRYRIHKSYTYQPLPQGNDNMNVKSFLKALPAGVSFKVKIDIHNLKKIEIGALLSAITLHNNNASFHNIGLAKGFGFGKIKLSIIKLHGLTYDMVDYLKAFEDEMSMFCTTYMNMLWHATPEIKSLMSIASVHAQDDLKMMDLDQYKFFRTNNNFDSLIESDIDVNHYVDGGKIKEALKKEQYKSEIRRAENLERNGDYVAAISEYKKLIDLFFGLDVSEFLAKIDILENKRLEAINNAARISNEEEVRKRVDSNNVPLLKKIETQTSIGAVIGNLKSWLKSNELADEDESALQYQLERIFLSLKPRDKKQYQELKKWKNLIDLIGNERAGQVLSKIVK